MYVCACGFVYVCVFVILCVCVLLSRQARRVRWSVISFSHGCQATSSHPDPAARSTRHVEQPGTCRRWCPGAPESLHKAHWVMNVCDASPSLGVRELGRTQGRLRLPRGFVRGRTFSSFPWHYYLVKVHCCVHPPVLSQSQETFSGRVGHGEPRAMILFSLSM